MTSILLIFALVILGVAVVAWAVRGRESRPIDPQRDKDTAWNDPITPADAPDPRDPRP